MYYDDEDGSQYDDEELQRVLEMIRGASSIAINSYRRTRPIKGFPSEIMTKVLQKARMYREWIQRTRFPVPTHNLDAAISALTDSILDFRRTGGIFEPARYEGGADPRSAEHLTQFAQFLRQRMNQPLVYGKQWAEFGKYWDAFSHDLGDAFERWKMNR